MLRARALSQIDSWDGEARTTAVDVRSRTAGLSISHVDGNVRTRKVSRLSVTADGAAKVTNSNYAISQTPWERC